MRSCLDAITDSKILLDKFHYSSSSWPYFMYNFLRKKIFSFVFISVYLLTFLSLWLFFLLFNIEGRLTQSFQIVILKGSNILKVVNEQFPKVIKNGVCEFSAQKIIRDCTIEQLANPIVSSCSNPPKTSVLWSSCKEQLSRAHVSHVLSSPFSARFQGSLILWFFAAAKILCHSLQYLFWKFKTGAFQRCSSSSIK